MNNFILTFILLFIFLFPYLLLLQSTKPLPLSGLNNNISGITFQSDTLENLLGKEMDKILDKKESNMEYNIYNNSIKDNVVDINLYNGKYFYNNILFTLVTILAFVTGLIMAILLNILTIKL